MTKSLVILESNLRLPSIKGKASISAKYAYTTKNFYSNSKQLEIVINSFQLSIVGNQEAKFGKLVKKL